MNRRGFFCSAISRVNGESMYGTVARIRSWLLLEYPSFWRERAIEDSPRLSARVKEHLHDCERRGMFDRALLIRREHRRNEWLHAFFVRSCGIPPTMEQARFCSFEEVPMLERGEVVNGIIYAVCTHGRHDKCCAKFGIPVYRAFRDVVGERVWECSHVGGDRFAGNVIIFPHGLYYGRVAAADVPELVRRSERGEIWLDRYRGRSCFPRSIQIAEYFARLESGRLAIDEFQPVQISRAGVDGVSQVDLRAQSDGSIHRVVFATRPNAILEFLTCAAVNPKHVPQYELITYETA